MIWHFLPHSRFHHARLGYMLANPVCHFSGEFDCRLTDRARTQCEMCNQIGELRLVNGANPSAEIVNEGGEAAFEFCNPVVQIYAIEILLNADLGDVELDSAQIPTAEPHPGFFPMLTTFESSEHELRDRVMSPSGHDLG